MYVYIVIIEQGDGKEAAQQEMRGGAERQKRRRNDAKCVNPGMKILIQSPPEL